MHAWSTRSRARRGSARCRAVQRIIVRAALRRAPSTPRVAQRSRPPAARRASALSRQVPDASRLLAGLLPGLRMAVGFPLGPSGLSTQGVRVPVSARARCHQAQPGRAERCEARGGHSRSARWAPPFTPTRNRRCHASAVRRRPPRRWPEFLHETLPSRREIARLARRLEPQGIEAISVRGHRLCLRRHGRQQLVSIQCPRTPGRRLPDARCLKPEASGATAGSSTSDSGGRRPAITRGDARTHLRDSLDRHESGSGRGRLLNRRFRGAAPAMVARARRRWCTRCRARKAGRPVRRRDSSPGRSRERAEQLHCTRPSRVAPAQG